jgi:hypothetical protein
MQQRDIQDLLATSRRFSGSRFRFKSQRSDDPVSSGLLSPPPVRNRRLQNGRGLYEVSWSLEKKLQVALSEARRAERENMSLRSPPCKRNRVSYRCVFVLFWCELYPDNGSGWRESLKLLHPTSNNPVFPQ